MNSGLTNVTSGLTIVSAMVTPAILILASGNLVASTLTRIARVVDRARVLIDLMHESALSRDRDALEHHKSALQVFVRRSVLLERALSGFYLAIGLFVLSSLSVVLEVLRPEFSRIVTTGLVVLGGLVLLYGAVYVFMETRLATGTLRQEIALAEALTEKLSAHIS